MYSKEEKTILIGLGLPVTFLRFGKALVYLIFFYYALTFTDNEFLIGVAFGATALIQAILTLPFGFWSDKFGRKKMIIIGLILFIIGSLLAAYPFGNIYVLIFARFLQGSSAIYSCILAFIGDVIPKNKRSRTLGIFSILTGIVFSLGIILGPTIAPGFLPYSFLFILSAVLGSIALVYLVIFVEEPKIKSEDAEISSDIELFKDVIKNRNLIITYFATFFTNFVLVAILLILAPKMLETYMPTEYSGLLLIPIFGFGMGVMYYTSKIADRGKSKLIAILGFILVGFGLIMFIFHNFILLIFGLFMFFTGMAILDPILPTFIITLATQKSKGTASGFYNVTRYLGEAIGPVASGFILLMFIVDYLLLILLILIIVSILLMISMRIITN